ncbi:SulP family inorganic anion transporter [Kitasatospora sp. NBC_01250]|uniref:SulP family inorganic anion transporter n=1 Tax=Kitasatospora sp. NBC_01250 TaxID=2903571 RepID=UPI002E324B9D|nr:SulP family inorganic anion transporter [Kitasatospora sp. NBC_01250]
MEQGEPEAEPEQDTTRPAPRDLLAGGITALFSVPEGMAYAAIAGLAPGSGLSSGVLPAMMGSLLGRTPLMITTLTSAIALTSGNALRHAHLDPTLPANVAALTLLVAAAMALFALLGLGAVLRGISLGAVTGFSLGTAVQIIAGALREATGYRARHHNRLLRLASWLAHPGAWSHRMTAVAVATVLVWALAHAVSRLRALAVLVALVVTGVLVHVAGITVPLAASLGTVPGGLPQLTVPNWWVMPHLVGGACSVAAVALAQAAAIAPGSPAGGPAAGEPVGRRAGRRDVLAQAAANAVGAFCHALPVGGSPSRTAVAVAAGARSRWAGVASGVVLALLLCFFGRVTGFIPLAVVGALLILIGVKLVLARLPEIALAWRRGWRERSLLVVTFLAATQLPLQYALLLGALLSGAAHAVGLLVGHRRVAATG